MILDDILIGKTAVSFRFKDEAVEFIRFMQDVIGDKLFISSDGFYYPYARFYDKCIRLYGNSAGDEPALVVKRVTDNDGEEKYIHRYCSTRYFKDNFYNVVYYSDIREDIFKADNAECWGGDVVQLLT